MIALQRNLVSLATVLFVAGFVGSATASAAPPPAVPDPGEPGYCGAHTNPMNCWNDVSPATTGEMAFINDERGRIPGDDTRLLQIVRGMCSSLGGGTSTSYLVNDISKQLGVSQDSADQAMNSALNNSCRDLFVGSDGVARRSGAPRGTNPDPAAQFPIPALTNRPVVWAIQVCIAGTLVFGPGGTDGVEKSGSCTERPYGTSPRFDLVYIELAPSEDILRSRVSQIGAAQFATGVLNSTDYYLFWTTDPNFPLDILSQAGFAVTHVR